MENIWKNNYLNHNRIRHSNRETENDPRNEFESDFGRVVFSPAIRRMHDKTQVFPLTTDDNIHSRLTHSLEVMSIGYSLGLQLCENKCFIEKSGLKENDVIRIIPIILKSSSLVHDIGNPPFGHFGEDVIQNYFTKLFKEKDFELTNKQKEDFTLFDGNAQGFRVLTKLQVLNDPYGLNLTLATLGSYLKYPNCDEINKKKLALKKRGVFQSEKEYLIKIAESCNLKTFDGTYKRHPLAFLTEAADSICYLVMDIEDGFNKGWFNYEQIKNIVYNIDSFKEKIDRKEIEFKGIGEEVSRVVNLRIMLIKYLVNLAVDNFIKNYDDICSGNYNFELINQDQNNVAKNLSDFCTERIFPKREIQFLELTGHSVLSGLLDYYIDFLFNEVKAYKKRGLGLISNSILRAAYIENGIKVERFDSFEKLTNYFKLRIVVDYISGMTDQFALNHYQKLSGQKII